MSEFHVGQLVVCVDVRVRVGVLTPPLQTGSIYRVAAIGVSPSGALNIDVVGIPRAAPLSYPNFRAWRFRPLNDDAEDTALVARIKACKPNRVKA